jgi:predicted transcriptional regulator
MSISKDIYDTIVAIVEERLRDVKVTREAFDALRGAVLSLAEAQRRTEERLETLAEGLLALTRHVDQLAEAQRRTEERLETLAEGLLALTRRVDQLAEAQRRTEEAVRALAQAVGRLSDTIGYGLEDIARVILPGYLERHLDIRVDELERRFIGPEGREVEIDLYGEGSQGGRRVVILGEARSRIYSSEVEQFDRAMRPVTESLPDKVIKVMVGYLIHPSASRLAAEKEILLVASYQR